MPWDDKTKSSGPWGGGSDDDPGKDGGSPWTRPAGGSGNGDLEQQMKRMQERFRKRSGGGGGGSTSMKMPAGLGVVGATLIVALSAATNPSPTAA